MIATPRLLPPRAFISLILGMACLAAVWLAADASASHRFLGRPNILFIVTDDQAYGTTGRPPGSSTWWMPSVQKWFRTGGLDAAGRPVVGGTESRQAWATNPLCCPSRGSNSAVSIRTTPG